MSAVQLHRHELGALDGSNLLAFLTALGVLRVLTTRAGHDARHGPLLSWEESGGIWRPIIHSPGITTRETLIGELATVCCTNRSALLREEIAVLKARVKERHGWRSTIRGHAHAEGRQKVKDEIALAEEQLANLEASLNALESERSRLESAANVREREFKEAEKAALKFKKEIDKQVQELPVDARKAARVEFGQQLEVLWKRKDDAERAWGNSLAALAPAPAFALGDDFSVAPARFADFARQAAEAARAEDHAWTDFVAAFACESCFDPKTQLVEDTAFRTVGGGQTRILNFIRELCAKTTPRHLDAALFHAWTYSDPPPSLRWDPSEYRPYALRATDPAPDQNSKVRGANRLAVEALPLFPVMPSGPRRLRLATTGFRRNEITWPIWTAPLQLDTVRSILALRELQLDKPDRAKLARLGVPQAMRARRFTEGQYRNFGPSVPLC